MGAAKQGKGVSTKSKQHQKLAQSNICAICRQSFPNTAKEATLKAHVEAKHSGKNAKTFKQCFPVFGQVTNDDSDNKYDNKNKKIKKTVRKRRRIRNKSILHFVSNQLVITVSS